MRWMLIGLTVVFLAGMGCGRNPCRRLAETVCAQAQGTPACERAGRFTNQDECEGYLKDVDRYIRLANEVVTTPVLNPPVPASAAPDPGAPSPTQPEAEPEAAPVHGSPEGAPSRPEGAP